MPTKIRKNRKTLSDLYKEKADYERRYMQCGDNDLKVTIGSRNFYLPVQQVDIMDNCCIVNVEAVINDELTNLQFAFNEVVCEWQLYYA